MTEDQCIGEHEDEDVRNERSKVFRMTTQEQPGQIQPVVLVKVSFRWFLSYDQRLAVYFSFSESTKGVLPGFAMWKLLLLCGR